MGPLMSKMLYRLALQKTQTIHIGTVNEEQIHVPQSNKIYGNEEQLHVPQANQINGKVIQPSAQRIMNISSVIYQYSVAQEINPHHPV